MPEPELTAQQQEYLARWDRARALYNNLSAQERNHLEMPRLKLTPETEVGIYNVPVELFTKFTDILGTSVEVKTSSKVFPDRINKPGRVTDWEGVKNLVEVSYPDGMQIIIPVELLTGRLEARDNNIFNHTCPHCQKQLEVGNKKRVNGMGERPYAICLTCHIERYFKCCECGKHCQTARHTETNPEMNKRICNSCFRRNFCKCNSCHATVRHGTLIGSFCSKCLRTRILRRALKSKSYKKTLGISRFFGIEVECIAPTREDGKPITNNERESEEDATPLADNASPRNHGRFMLRDMSHWEAGGDGSIDARGDDGMEYRSSILQGDKGVESLLDLCNKMKAAHHYVNRSCGLHVHTDVSDLTQDQLLNIASFIRIFDNIIFSLLPRSRSHNDYCQKINLPLRKLKESKLAKLGKLEHFSNMGRYRGFNLTAYHEHGTIEFRYHSGTTDFRKIYFWLLTCLLIVERQKDCFWDERTRALKPCRRNLNKFCKVLDMPKDLKEYWVERFITFNGKKKKKGDTERTRRGGVRGGRRTWDNPLADNVLSYDFASGDVELEIVHPVPPVVVARIYEYTDGSLNSMRTTETEHRFIREILQEVSGSNTLESLGAVLGSVNRTYARNIITEGPRNYLIQYIQQKITQVQRRND